MPLENSPILAYCPGPILPIDHTEVVIRGTGHVCARATVPAEFMVDGKKAGPGRQIPLEYSDKQLITSKCYDRFVHFINSIKVTSVQLFFLDIFS